METLSENSVKQFDERLARVEANVERVRRYLFWGLVAQLALVLLPILALMVAVPFLLSQFSRAYQGLL